MSSKIIKKEKGLHNVPLTYISLFSSAGVGCFGFKRNGFECIATNELIERRIKIQKINNKCKYDTGYICGDITNVDTKSRIKFEIDYWKHNHGIESPDVIIATPPCQGMSVANHKKNANEIERNSLVIESIMMVKDVKPKVFIFENVASFLRTACVDTDESVISISEAINRHLLEEYTIHSDVLNFKNYGSNSSRTRTLVIGVLKKYANDFSPEELFHKYKNEKTLKEVIGHLTRFTEMGEIDDSDILHGFRKYDERMRCWITDLKEGESAFDNESPLNKPHQVIDGIVVPNKKKNGDKYTRQFWDKIAPCIHTRNDQLASQSTIHPVDDRVFSIRELMLMMSIPEEFKWFEEEIEFLNRLPYDEKVKILKSEEINIRQSIGEAVPTGVFDNIARNLKKRLKGKSLSEKQIKEIIDREFLKNHKNLMKFLIEESFSYNLKTISSIAEYANAYREQNAAYYTDKMLLHSIFSIMPTINKESVSILEPSVGVGSFIPIIARKYSNSKMIEIDCVDINYEALEILKFMIDLYDLGDNVRINYINQDFLKMEVVKKYDLCIGNPPFGKFKVKKSEVKSDFVNYESKNIASYFLEKSMKYSEHVVMIMPKNFLNTTDFNVTRKHVANFNVKNIIDFGEFGFKGVLVETVCLAIDTGQTPSETTVLSLPLGVSKLQRQSYITSNKHPYWIIYRNDYFDNFIDNLQVNIFDVFRDRQLTNSNMTSRSNDRIRVIKSRNITDDGRIIDIIDYDAYIDRTALNQFAISRFINDEVYLTPNMTYKTRLMRKPKDTITNGSVAILIPKKKINLTTEDMKFFASPEYREYMQIARNYQTRTLNVDNNSVFFYGIRKETL